MEKLNCENCKNEEYLIPDDTNKWSICDVCEDGDCFEPMEQEQQDGGADDSAPFFHARCWLLRTLSV